MSDHGTATALEDDLVHKAQANTRKLRRDLTTIGVPISPTTALTPMELCLRRWPSCRPASTCGATPKWRTRWNSAVDIGNAPVGALEFLEKEDLVHFVNLSRLFVYYNQRAIEHTMKSDSGAMLRDGIKPLLKPGVGPS